MKQLKEHWPLLLILAIIAWALYPVFVSGDQGSEYPGAVLHRQTAEYKQAKAMFEQMNPKQQKVRSS